MIVMIIKMIKMILMIIKMIMMITFSLWFLRRILSFSLSRWTWRLKSWIWGQRILTTLMAFKTKRMWVQLMILLESLFMLWRTLLSNKL
jgi:hypothetical protein